MWKNGHKFCIENENIYNNKFENNDNTYLNDKELIGYHILSVCICT